jgi:hypothetical protein
MDIRTWNYRFLFLFLFIASCIEPYEFVVHDETRTLVVEASISDKSFFETLSYPSDGRYFKAKLSYTGDVTNTRPVLIQGALVTLVSDQGDSWLYTEYAGDPGVYALLDDNFRAEPGEKYSLRIVLPNDETYASSWEELPATDVPLVGHVSFSETEVQRYVVEAGKEVLRTVKGLTPRIEVPARTSTGSSIYYRWNSTPLWIYVAPLSSSSSPVYRCWATDLNYIRDYTLQEDNGGGYGKDLFFMETIRNERIFEDFSLLVTQYAMNERTYNFWRELQEQSQAGAVFDAPPYNLLTNFHSVDNNKRVSGYFDVSQEQATRWYFNKNELSYYVENTLKADCLVDYGPGGPAEECTNCLAYSFGIATNIRPLWWRQ